MGRCRLGEVREGFLEEDTLVAIFEKMSQI